MNNKSNSKNNKSKLIPAAAMFHVTQVLAAPAPAPFAEPETEALNSELDEKDISAKSVQLCIPVDQKAGEACVLLPPLLSNKLFGTSLDCSLVNYIAPCAVCGQSHHPLNEEHLLIYVDSDDDLKKQNVCDPILYEPIFDPRFVTCCKNTFSKFTIEKAVQKDHKCPFCRKPLTMKDITEAPLFMVQLFDKLRVRCPWGCDQEMDRILLPVHLQACPFGMVKCGVAVNEERCPLMVCRGDEARHHAVCEYKPVTCEQGCSATMTRHQASSHNCVRHLGAKVARLEETVAALIRRLEAVEFVSNKNVSVSGAQGPKAKYINGVFDLTDSVSVNGCPVYRRRNEPERMLVFSSVNSWWVILHESSMPKVSAGNAPTNPLTDRHSHQIHTHTHTPHYIHIFSSEHTRATQHAAIHYFCLFCLLFRLTSRTLEGMRTSPCLPGGPGGWTSVAGSGRST